MSQEQPREIAHIEYIDKNLDLIQNQNQLSAGDLKNFAIQCKRTGLDPITRQIYALKTGDKMNIMASIDGLRLIAERSGAYEGQTKPEWCDKDGKWHDIWLSSETPMAARIGVYKTKFREPLYGVALFHEYAGKYTYDDNRGNKYKKGDLTYMWAKMPALMIAKVAEALALRKAFPNEMSGIYATEEISEPVESQAQQNVSAIKEVIKETGFVKEEPIKKITPEVIQDSIGLGDYVIQFGKHKGKKFSEMDFHGLCGYIDWIPTGLKGRDGNPVVGKLKESMEECYQAGLAYKKSFTRKVDPKFDESEEIPY